MKIRRAVITAYKGVAGGIPRDRAAEAIDAPYKLVERGPDKSPLVEGFDSGRDLTLEHVMCRLAEAGFECERITRQREFEVGVTIGRMWGSPHVATEIVRADTLQEACQEAVQKRRAMISVHDVVEILPDRTRIKDPR